MATFSIRRLSDATLKKYAQIVESGGELTPRQQKALEGHALITNDAFVTALLRPDKVDAPKTYYPFANGAQSSDWEASNCARCNKFYSHIECPILEAIVHAYLGTGDVSEDTARRMGYLKADGSTDGRFAWPCAEVEWTAEWQAEYTQRQAAQAEKSE